MTYSNLNMNLSEQAEIDNNGLISTLNQFDWQSGEEGWSLSDDGAIVSNACDCDSSYPSVFLEDWSIYNEDGNDNVGSLAPHELSYIASALKPHIKKGHIVIRAEYYEACWCNGVEVLKVSADGTAFRTSVSIVNDCYNETKEQLFLNSSEVVCITRVSDLFSFDVDESDTVDE